ncbi:DUF2637 domain-containing protein [Actinocorallia sp. B10E7]|uniref:DUF2637 domain-containing protein n=1 Tax=Actinocorallia sp. B10E7 TaxID=3153558 RepID=UPI00325EF6DB
MTSAPTRSQRLFAVLGFLAVAGLTAGAFVLSYDALRLLALAGLEGKNAERFGRYYPMVYDGLVVVALLAVFVARHSSWWVRWTRWLVLVALVGGGIAASVQHAVKGFEPIEGTALEAGVASAPWVAALLAIWLWMSMLRQAREGSRQRRADRRHTPAHAKRTNDAPALIPGLVEDRPESQTDPLPLPTAEDLPEAYREPVEPVEPEPVESREEEAAETEPWDSPWPGGIREDGVREDLGEEPEPARPPLTLPTDVKLVGRGVEDEKPDRDEDILASTTQPDFPVPGRKAEPLRAEDSGTDEDWIGYSPEHNPPSGSFRSAPLPPEED